MLAVMDCNCWITSWVTQGLIGMYGGYMRVVRYLGFGVQGLGVKGLGVQGLYRRLGVKDFVDSQV